MKTARWVSRGIGLLALVVIAAGCATPEPPSRLMVMKQTSRAWPPGHGTAACEVGPWATQCVIYADGSTPRSNPGANRFRLYASSTAASSTTPRARRAR
jgi:hypothetical protein